MIPAVAEAARWDETPAGLVTTDLEGLVLDVNPTLLRWLGRERGDVVGTTRLSDLLTVGGRIYWETHLAPLLRAEGRLDEVALELRTAGQRVPVLLTAVRRDGERGTPDRVHLVVVASRERARFERELRSARADAEREAAELAALQQVTAALSSAGGLDAVAGALLRAVQGPLRTAAARLWVHRPGQGFAAQGDDSAVLDAQDLADVDRGRVAVRRPDGRVLVPCHGQERLRAVLELAFRSGPGDEPPRLQVLTTLGQQGGLAFDRAWQQEQRAGVSHALQRSLLADEPPRDARFEVAATYRPGVESLEVGGDWYDVFRTDPRECAPLSVVVGDVVGRGLRAAVVMGQLRSALRAVTGPGTGPGDVLSAMDRFAWRTDAAHSATVALAHLDLDEGHVRYACAGHLPPVLLPADGEPRLLWGGRSMPLAVLEDPPPHLEAEVSLAVGDSLVLYTDGLVERAWRGLDQGLRTLVDAVRDVRGLPLHQAVREVTERLLADESNRDDACLLIVRWRGPSASAAATATATVEAARSSPA